MKNVRNILLLFTILVTAFSCKKHEILYDTTPVVGEAEFQLHYVVPLASGAANNIYKVEINGELYANTAGPLTVFNAIPSGSVGRFFVTKTGVNNIKLYQGNDLTLVYDKDVTLTAGKQNVFVYDFNQPPIVINNGFPYQPVVTERTGTLEWIKFYNFMFETAGVPTTLKLQYQYQYTTNIDAGTRSDWLNVGNPLSFGEGTDWVPIPVITDTTVISSGNARIDYRIRMVDASGNDLGSLQIMNSASKYVDYSDWWTGYIGRRYHHILAGIRSGKPGVAIKLFTAL